MSRLQIVTAGIIARKDWFLLIKRAREPFRDFWAFPSGCGAFLYGIDPKEAVIREVKCDIGCEFHPEFFTYSYDNFDNKPSIVLYFSGDINGIPSANPKYVSDYRWFPFDKAKELDMAFGQAAVLRKFIDSDISGKI
ncbi:MAG: NUDIX hydrolase [Nanoarchaeota archaeon]